MAKPRLAVLIDGENASVKIVDILFKEIAKHGIVGECRLYGDFKKPYLKSWDEVLDKYKIEKKQNCAHAPGKNVSDIALVVDAMDLLHAGEIQIFCIVSSDSDFTRLAKRLHDGGKKVFGFGTHQTTKAYRKACDDFVIVEKPRKPQNPPAPRRRRILPPTQMVPHLRKAADSVSDGSGWSSVEAVKKKLHAAFPNFDPRAYGRDDLIELIRATGAFAIVTSDGSARFRFSAPHKKTATR
jgi:hypothetical protein